VSLRVLVIGAGAFGGWTALNLLRGGAAVTLLDAWGPGNQRASSSGETRALRGTYGDRAVYTRMAARAMRLWREHEERSGRRFFHRIGVLWIFGDDASFGEASIEPMRAEGLPVEWLDVGDLRRRFPMVSLDDVTRALWEPEGGYALARRSCEHVVEAFQAEGGEYRVAAVKSPVETDGHTVTLTDDTSLTADAIVFACGPWLGTLFPDVVGRRIRATRQESFYFGTPAGDARWLEPHMPVWLDHRDHIYYGMPGNANRGFKVADDTHGTDFDPTDGDRQTTVERLEAARALLRRRFPTLADAPVVGTEVCQYEVTPDTHYVVDRHPAHDSVWIVGGGSGHGFKMGPAVGEHVASLVRGDAMPDPTFALLRPALQL
jgi:sarcosine oxidase